MRAFIAVELDDATRQAVILLQKRLKQRVENLRWVGSEQLHLTLVFLGEILDSQSTDISAALDDVAKMHGPFVVRFDRLGVFPPRGSVSVLWLGVGDGAREMIALQALVTQRLAALGFPPEDRPYTPHLTLARNRDPGAGRRVRAMLDDHPVVKIPEMRVRRVTFFRSNLQSPAARHEPMTEHVLMSECR